MQLSETRVGALAALLQRLRFYRGAIFIFGIHDETKKRIFMAPAIRVKLCFISISPRLYPTTIHRR